MKILLLILLFGLSLFGSIGKISASNGKVDVERNNEILEATVGFSLEEKDLVITYEKSKAQITLNDGSVLSLGKNSKLDINEYVFDEKNPSQSKANFRFAEGAFKSITGAIGKVAPDKFKLETKSATIGIRGTIIVGNQERIACTHGKIEVTSAGVTQVLNAGMMTNTEQGKPPTPPTKIEGNILNEIYTVGSKEESTTTTIENDNNQSTTESKSESQNQQSNNLQNTTITNSFSEVVSEVNDKILQNIITQQVEIKKEEIASQTTEKLTYIPFYSTNLSFDNEGFTNIINFKVSDEQISVTIATYGIEDSLSAHRLILMKLINAQDEEYDFITDSFVWTGTENFANAILNYQDFERNATYGVFISVDPLYCSEDSSAGCVYASNNSSKLYFTSSSELQFLNSNEYIIKYGYSDSINNLAYISSSNGSVTGLENNPKLRILADSKVGTTISNEYGYFVTISDNFNSINYENNEPSLTDAPPQTNVFLNNIENIDGSSWGYWATTLNSDNPLIDMKSTWVSGNKIAPSENYNASFSGQVIGGITGSTTEHIKLDSNNIFQATVNIGTASINGSINFQDTSNTNWSGSFLGIANKEGFTAQIVQSSLSISSDGPTIIGSLRGNYYGAKENIQSIGGTFGMSQMGSSGLSTAQGVFKAGLSSSTGGN